MTSVQKEIQTLKRKRSRDRLTEACWWTFAIVLFGSWFLYDFNINEFFSARRLGNAKAFLGELVPHPLQGHAFDLRVALVWAWEILIDHGFTALGQTLAIALLAISLAALLGFAASLLGSKDLVLDECLGREAVPCWRCRARLCFVCLVKISLIFLRAIPEYIWAFVLLMVLGVSALPAVLALLIHNLGILGKLGAELSDNLPKESIFALRQLGARRAQIGLFGIAPRICNRFLLFVFVRWETCVRESTVLGLLGMMSLGYWVEDARSRNYYDEMFFMIMLGAVLVLFGDLTSTLFRTWLRRI